MEYHISFRIANFDEYGQEHRLFYHDRVSFTQEKSLSNICKQLIEFASKITNSDPHNFPAKRIEIKSAWQDTGKKTRISHKLLLEEMIKLGIAVKGREEQKIALTKAQSYIKKLKEKRK